MAAYTAAVRAGVGPLAFWELTPYQAQAAMRGLQDGRTELAWEIANLTRAKRLPELKRLVSKPWRTKQEMGERLKAALMQAGLQAKKPISGTRIPGRNDG